MWAHRSTSPLNSPLALLAAQCCCFCPPPIPTTHRHPRRPPMGGQVCAPHTQTHTARACVLARPRRSTAQKKAYSAHRETQQRLASTRVAHSVENWCQEGSEQLGCVYRHEAVCVCVCPHPHDTHTHTTHTYSQPTVLGRRGMLHTWGADWCCAALLQRAV
jgi:hypothetical protein